jgi:hypothetical protein
MPVRREETTGAVLVCHERVYPGTHFPSDIIAEGWIGLPAPKLALGWLTRRGSRRNDLAPSRRW